MSCLPISHLFLIWTSFGIVRSVPRGEHSWYLVWDTFLNLERYKLIPKQPRLTTLIGILVPLAEVGAAAILEMSNSALTDAAVEGGMAGRMGITTEGEGGAATGEGAAQDPHPVSPGQANVNPAGNPRQGVNPAPPPKGGDGTTPVTVKPQGSNPKIRSPTFIGNVGWVAPGTMTSIQTLRSS